MLTKRLTAFQSARINMATRCVRRCFAGLQKLGHEVLDLGSYRAQSVDYPDITANGFVGVRAASRRFAGPDGQALQSRRATTAKPRESPARLQKRVWSVESQVTSGRSAAYLRIAVRTKIAIPTVLLTLIAGAFAAAQDRKSGGCLAGVQQKVSWVQVSDDRQGFVLEQSGRPFMPWGFNYDHDENGRLLEDYWDREWPKIEEDFQEMKQLGANVVRIHLQVGKFMASAHQPNAASLDRLGRLVVLAEQVGLYLDITGLACYRKKDVPQWYDDLAEQERWDVQSRFWEAVAQRCAKSPAVFCYDLMNEPVVPGGARKPGDWLGPPFLGLDSGYFVQFITLDQRARPRPEIARQWCHQLAAAIRKHDPRRLVTVGLVPWSLDRPGLTSGVVPRQIVGDLDFIAVHIYPEKGKIQASLETLSGFAVGKPIVIEETAPLNCSLSEFEHFLAETRKSASGWIGFYWGKTPDEYRKSNTLPDALMLDWLEFFQRHVPPGSPSAGIPDAGQSRGARPIQRSGEH